MCCSPSCFFFFFNDTATTEIYTLSLHDALPISHHQRRGGPRAGGRSESREGGTHNPRRSEEHTSELQSRLHLVCRLLLEKKKKTDSCKATPRKTQDEVLPASRTPRPMITPASYI